jgi:hypothetical protein
VSTFSRSKQGLLGKDIEVYNLYSRLGLDARKEFLLKEEL